jgi:hypothetical protein
VGMMAEIPVQHKRISMDRKYHCLDMSTGVIESHDTRYELK